LAGRSASRIQASLQTRHFCPPNDALDRGNRGEGRPRLPRRASDGEAPAAPELPLWPRVQQSGAKAQQRWKSCSARDGRGEAVKAPGRCGMTSNAVASGSVPPTARWRIWPYLPPTPGYRAQTILAALRRPAQAAEAVYVSRLGGHSSPPRGLDTVLIGAIDRCD
jgi:hypothetical protein